MSDFYFEHANLDLGTTSVRYRNNVQAIRIVKDCLEKKRAMTGDEEAILSHYVGWGDSRLTDTFLKDWEVQRMLTREEVSAIRGSTLNAHYTALDVIHAIWRVVVGHMRIDKIGIIRTLDPSAGIGHFKSMTPAPLRPMLEWTEVELDILTSQILHLLHSDSRVMNVGFEKASLPDMYFNLAISNVPFGNYPVPTEKKLPKMATASIHDFFFANTVSLLKPGGVMVYITSRYTMDKKDKTVREFLARYCDLLGMVRLPNTAFKYNANTEVITDIVFLQKRRKERVGEEPRWVNVYPLTQFITGNDSEAISINGWYHDHPDMVLGKATNNGTMYRSDGYNVEPHTDRPLEDQIVEALINVIPPDCFLNWEVDTVSNPEREAQIITNAPKSKTPEQEAILASLKEIYTIAKKLLGTEMKGISIVESSELRFKLNKTYDAFKQKYGPINKPTTARLLNDSVEGPFLKALELYDDKKSTAVKAGIFTSPMVRSIKKIGSDALSPSDALVVSMDEKGRIDIPFMASLTDRTENQLLIDLGDVIFHNPMTDQYETADQYLSGNVRLKWQEANRRAEFDGAYQRNADALKKVMPEDLKPGEIVAPLGAGWIPEEVISDFVLHLLQVRPQRVNYVPKLALWNVEMFNKNYIPTGLMYTKWGTSRISAYDILMCGLNAQQPVVWDLVQGPDGDDRRVINQTETAGAQQKLAEIKSEFDRWLWSVELRAKELCQLYNERFNSYVSRTYNGAHLSLPGLNLAISPRPAQKDVVWRTLQTQRCLISHPVGMGKTLALTIAIMENKRLGFTRKAIVVVPNHLTGQWHASILWAYPNANVLVAKASDLSKENRGRFLSSIATNDWDMVIVPFSTFKLLPVSGETMKAFFQKEIDTLRDYLDELKKEDSESKSIKDIEKAIKRFEAKLEKASYMQKDNAGTITWEEMGVDFLACDEFHGFKNLFYSSKMTRVAGLTNSDSQRAFDMYVKSSWTTEHGGKFVGMTGTPLSNSIAEMFTMQRYFQPELLEEMGLSHFDAWAMQFTTQEPILEMAPDGSGFRMGVRLSFVNMTELMQMWNQVVDSKTIDEKSGIVRPNIYGGKPIRVVSFGGEVLDRIVDNLVTRSEAVKSGQVDPRDDNALVIANDGRKAALDPSLVVSMPPGSPMPKIDQLVDTVARVYHASKAVNGTQFIFCDLGTPKAKKDPVDDPEDKKTK